tara:strand:- start:608 stop:1069 length:462 start_codon:yes stop_codon:yes gene_type:complete
MSKFAIGKRSQAISDRSGQAFPYDEMVREWNGALVHVSEYEPKHPQIRRRRTTADAIALQNARPQKFQQPQFMSSLNPTFAPGDSTIVDSGGESVGVANLTLPGDFAFRTQEFITTNDGVTTSVQSMQPENPSLQNRRRQLNFLMGKVTISIS